MTGIIMLHGWRERDGGKQSLGPLADVLRADGREVILYNYGYVFTRAKTERVSRQTAMLLSARLEEGFCVVGFSNGARVAWELSFHAPYVKTMIWLHPALNANFVPARSVERCLVVHSHRDWATRLARYIPGGSAWGAMGNVGYRPLPRDHYGTDPRMSLYQDSGRHSTFNKDPEMWAGIVGGFADEIDDTRIIQASLPADF